MATPKVLTRLQRHLLMGLAVLLLHLALIGALQSGLVSRIKEVIVPVVMLSQFMDLSKPTPVQPRSAPLPLAKTQPSLALQTPPPQTLSMTQAPPIAAAAAAVTPMPAATAAAPATEAVAIASKPELTTKPPAPARVQSPSAQADYLQNPKPPYPALSRRLSEQGLVVHSVLIGVDGRAISARLVKSSGFDRLDKASYDAIMRWRYSPGLRDGVPEAMSFNVPLNWVLE